MTRVRYIGPGGAVAVANIPAARTFAPGDVVDLDGEVLAATKDRAAQTWRDVLGHVSHLFEPADTREEPAPFVVDSPDDSEE